jgi:hypothetical protein
MGNSAPLGPPMAPRLRSWGQINWFHSGFRPLWGRAFLQAGTVRIRTAHGPKAALLGPAKFLILQMLVDKIKSVGSMISSARRLYHYPRI